MSAKYVGVGEVFVKENEPYVRVNAGQYGCVIYGPYEYFGVNKYRVQFDIFIGDDFVRDGRNFCFVDITADQGRNLIDKIVVNSDSVLKAGIMSIVVPFSIDAPSRLEFRLSSLGTQPFSVRYDRVVSTVDLVEVGSARNKFYIDNIDWFKKLSYLGARIEPSEEGVIVDWMGVRLLANNREDFFVIDEIFKQSNYNFGIAADVCVIDVGMNVGVASLYWANMASVRVVHSFEPFSRPFARALRNFELNPHISGKIKPRQVGLSGRTEVLEVKCSEIETVSTSIRGRNGSAVDRISVQDAAEAMRPLIQEAIENRQAVAVKLDCEGSEFAIIESAYKNELLNKINIFMIEWHKWWSVDKTDKDIVDPLVKTGFCVFDFLRVENPAASMIYAARS